MPTTIEVNKQSVEALLGSGKSKPFVIPEYQRPYAWTDEQVETLFEDLWEFTATSGGTEREGSYFLGSIVSYENEDGEQEIIDGQQRITLSIMLCGCFLSEPCGTIEIPIYTIPLTAGFAWRPHYVLQINPGGRGADAPAFARRCG